MGAEQANQVYSHWSSRLLELRSCASAYWQRYVLLEETVIWNMLGQ
jgi:hypothetical protein